MEAPGSSPGGAARRGRALVSRLSAELAFRLSPTVLLRNTGGGLAGLVAIARGKTPDPIPNSAVKTLSADGTG